MRPQPVSPAHDPRRADEEPPRPGRWWVGSPTESGPAAESDLVAWKVFRRLQQLSLNHAEQAWRHRYDMPLAPFVLAFLYAQPGPRTNDVVVTAATRLWHAGPEAQYPLPLLGKFTSVIRDHAAAMTGAATTRPEPGSKPEPLWDLRTGLADRWDHEMSDDAEYLGLGFSTLDTEAGTFADFCQRASTELGLPAAFCYVSHPSGIYLSYPPIPDHVDVDADHRAFTAHRYAAVDHQTIAIHSFQAFNVAQLVAPYPYAKVQRDQLYEQSPYAMVLRAMWQLDQAARAADTARRDAIRAARSRGRRRS